MTDINNLHLPLQTINVPQDNDATLIFSVYDESGDLVDLDGTTEIEFAIFTEPKGTREIEKTLTGTDITIFGNDYQFSVPITDLDTQALTNRLSYYECQVTNSGGAKRTVAAGIFRAEKTSIWSST